MFEKCTAMILTESNEVRRLDVDKDTQAAICGLFAESVNELITNKSKVQFDGSYKPEKDEFLYISNFKLEDEILDAIRNPLGVDSYEIDEEIIDIKAIFVGLREEDNDNEKFSVAFQRFRKDQYIATSKINLFFDKNTFRREKNFGISISESVDCFYKTDELQFYSFYFARQIFDLSEYYRSATDQEVSDFSASEHLELENIDNFKNMANTAIRRKIAMINDSKVLEEHTPAEIKKLAKQVGIDIEVKNKKIVIPDDKDQVKMILSFLDEEAYKGPFSQNTYVVNSKRKVTKN